MNDRQISKIAKKLVAPSVGEIASQWMFPDFENFLLSFVFAKTRPASIKMERQYDCLNTNLLYEPPEPEASNSWVTVDGIDNRVFDPHNHSYRFLFGKLEGYIGLDRMKLNEIHCKKTTVI